MELSFKGKLKNDTKSPSEDLRLAEGLCYMHQVFLENCVLQWGQVMRIFPFPLGTRSVPPQWAQVK